MKKRLLSLLLCLIMLMSLMPAAAFAEGEDASAAPALPQISTLHFNFTTADSSLNTSCDITLSPEEAAGLYTSPAEGETGWTCQMLLKSGGCYSAAFELAGIDTIKYAPCKELSDISLLYTESGWTAEGLSFEADTANINLALFKAGLADFSLGFTGDGNNAGNTRPASINLGAAYGDIVLPDTNGADYHKQIQFDLSKYKGEAISDLSGVKSQDNKLDSYIFLGDSYEAKEDASASEGKKHEHKLDFVLPDDRYVKAIFFEIPETTTIPMIINLSITGKDFKGNSYTRTSSLNPCKALNKEITLAFNSIDTSYGHDYWNDFDTVSRDYPSKGRISALYPKYDVNTNELNELSYNIFQRKVLAADAGGETFFTDPCHLISYKDDAGNIIIEQYAKQSVKITAVPDKSYTDFDKTSPIQFDIYFRVPGGEFIPYNESLGSDSSLPPARLSLNWNEKKQCFATNRVRLISVNNKNEVLEYQFRPVLLGHDYVLEQTDNPYDIEFSMKKFVPVNGDVALKLDWQGLAAGETPDSLGITQPYAQLYLNDSPFGSPVQLQLDAAKNQSSALFTEVPQTDAYHHPSKLEVRIMETAESEPGTEALYYTLSFNSAVDSDTEPFKTLNYTAAVKAHHSINIVKNWENTPLEPETQFPETLIQLSYKDKAFPSESIKMSTPKGSAANKLSINVWSENENLSIAELQDYTDSKNYANYGSWSGNDFVINDYLLKNSPVYVSKNWNGAASHPEQITVNLYRFAGDSLTAAPEKLSATVLSADNALSPGIWSLGEFPDKYSDGSSLHDYMYLVKEEAVPGFDVNYPDAVSDPEGVSYAKAMSYNDGLMAKISNTEYPKITLHVRTEWVDAGVHADNYKYQLLADGKKQGEPFVVPCNESKDAGQVSFSDRQQFNPEDRSPIVYSIDKNIVVPGYETKVGPAVLNSDGSQTITIVHVRNGFDLKVNKLWVDAAAHPDTITAELYADGTLLDTLDISSDAEGNMSGTFRNLPIKNDQGSDIKYSVKESCIEGFMSSYSDMTALEGDKYNKEITITNTRDSFDLHINKVWAGGDKHPEAVNVEIYAGEALVKELEIKADAEGRMSAVLENLPLHDKDGNEIKYSVKEKPVEGYDTAYSAISDIEGQPYQKEITITNTEYAKFDLYVKKTWVNANSHPDSVHCRLYADDRKISEFNINCKEGASGAVVFRGISERDEETGKKIVYRVEEDAVPGFNAVITAALNAGEGKKMITITNTAEIPDGPLTELTVNICWRNTVQPPASTRIRLVTNGVPGDWVKVSKSANPDTGADQWTYTFKNLAVNDAEGNPIKYSIDEEPIRNYKISISEIDDNNTVTITNTRIGKGVPTGDESNLGLWLGIGGAALVAVAVVAVVVIKKSKKSDEDEKQ